MISTYEPVAGTLRALHDAATTILPLSNVALATTRKTVARRSAGARTGSPNLETIWESDSHTVAAAELKANETQELEL